MGGDGTPIISSRIDTAPVTHTAMRCACALLLQLRSTVAGLVATSEGYAGRRSLVVRRHALPCTVHVHVVSIKSTVYWARCSMNERNSIGTLPAAIARNVSQGSSLEKVDGLRSAYWPLRCTRRGASTMCFLASRKAKDGEIGPNRSHTFHDEVIAWVVRSATYDSRDD